MITGRKWPEENQNEITIEKRHVSDGIATLTYKFLSGSGVILCYEKLVVQKQDVRKGTAKAYKYGKKWGKLEKYIRGRR